AVAATELILAGPAENMDDGAADPDEIVVSAAKVNGARDGARVYDLVGMIGRTQRNVAEHIAAVDKGNGTGNRFERMGAAAYRSGVGDRHSRGGVDVDARVVRCDLT